MSALQHFQAALAEKRGAIAGRLPAHLSPDRLIKIAITAAAKNPKILDCDKESVMLSVMQAAELGLEPGGALGEGYLVPYGKTCQFIPGYRGLVSLARRSGQIQSIEARAVFAADHFEVEFGLETRLTHRPSLDAQRGEIVAFYAVAHLAGGGTQMDYMTRADVDAIRARSRASGSGPWVTDYAEMGKKTVVRRLFKMLPCSVEMVRALELQAGAEAGSFDASLEVMQADDARTQDANDIAAQVAAEGK